MDYVEGGGMGAGAKVGIIIAVLVVVLVVVIVALYFTGTFSSDKSSDTGSKSTGTGSGSTGSGPVKDYTQWACYDGIYVPIKKGNAAGDPACLSRDGTNCVWSTDDAGCRSTLANIGSPVNPLTCGDDSKAKWGITGYEDPIHWCAKGKKIMV